MTGPTDRDVDRGLRALGRPSGARYTRSACARRTRSASAGSCGSSTNSSAPGVGGRPCRWTWPPTTCTANRSRPSRPSPPTTSPSPSADRGARPGTPPGSASAGTVPAELGGPPGGAGLRHRQRRLHRIRRRVPGVAGRPAGAGALAQSPRVPAHRRRRRRRGRSSSYVEAAANPPSPFGANPWPLLLPEPDGAPLFTLQQADLHVRDPGVRGVLARLPGAGRAADRAPRRRAPLRPALRRARASLQPARAARHRRQLAAGPARPRRAARRSDRPRTPTRSASSATPIWTRPGCGRCARRSASAPAPSARCSSSWTATPSTGSWSPRPSTWPGCATTTPICGSG